MADPTSPDGQAILMKVRQSASAGEWRNISQALNHHLGNPGGVGEYSPIEHMANYAKLAPRSKATIFGGGNIELRKALDQLATMPPEHMAILQAAAAPPIAARVMETPKYVRWVTAVARAKAKGNTLMVDYQVNRLPSITGGDQEMTQALSDYAGAEIVPAPPVVTNQDQPKTF